jgi:fatty-acyl-CoA synthase
MSPPTIFQTLERVAAAGRGSLVFHLPDRVATLRTPELVQAALDRAARLTAWGVRPGERIGVLGMNDPEWAAWAFAVWAAGAVLTPIPYSLRVGDREGLSERIEILARAAGCRLVMTDSRFAPFLPGVATAWDAIDADLLPEGEPAAVDLSDAAIVQFTSGSTANPKPLVVSHRAVGSLVESVLTLFGPPDVDRHVSWLPFFHDWGLIHFLVMSQLTGVDSHIMPTERFARAPQEWLRLVSEVRATFTGGPPSAWAVALKLVGERNEEVDLSSLRYCLLGAEMIEPEVLDRLIKDGGRLGLAREALACGWGLAEATFCLTCPAPGVGPRVDTVDGRLLSEEARAVPVSGQGKRVVGAGAPMPGVEVRVVDEAGDVLPERRVGEVQARAPYLMEGYLRPVAASPFTDDGWLRTGDLGYLADGDLFITGRIKDLIIVFGRNYAPEDVEWAAARVQGVRAGRAVAFAKPAGHEGEFVVAVEARATERADALDSLADRVRQGVAEEVGITPTEVIVVPKGWIPRTTSGKLRRAAARDAYAADRTESLVGQTSTGPPLRQ